MPVTHMARHAVLGLGVACAALACHSARSSATANSAAPGVSSTAVAPATSSTADAWPALVEGTLPAPREARLVGRAASGHLLLRVHADVIRKPTPVDLRLNRSGGALGAGLDPNKPSRFGVEYYAVLDDRQCVVETHTFQALADARVPDVAHLSDDLAAPFQTPEVKADLSRLRELGARFGTRNLADVAFGAGADQMVIAADPTLLVARGGRISVLEVGAAYAPRASLDGAYIGFDACGTPCAGFYPLSLLDVATGKVRRTNSGSIHEDGAFWQADGTLIFGYDDTTRSGSHMSKLCVGGYDPRAGQVKTLTCVAAASGEMRASPQGKAVAIVAEGAGGQSSLVLFSRTKDGVKEWFRTADRPLLPEVDDRGLVAWTDNDGKDFHFRVHVAVPPESGLRVDPIPEATFVGFAGTPSDAAPGVLTIANHAPSNEQPATDPMKTAGRCGLFRIEPLRK
jgi:hypothetical protein